MAQDEAREIVARAPAHRAVEVHRPDRGTGAVRHMPHEECGMRQIELEIERVVLARAHVERCVEGNRYRYGQVGARALGVLDLNLIARDRGARRRRKARLRIRRGDQQDVGRISAHGEDGAGIRAGRKRGIADELVELIEHREIGERRGGGSRVDRHIAAPALRDQRDGQDPDADRRPVLRGRIAHQHGEVGVLRSRGGGAGARSAGASGAAAAAACSDEQRGHGDRQESRLVEHNRNLLELTTIQRRPHLDPFDVIPTLDR